MIKASRINFENEMSWHQEYILHRSSECGIKSTTSRDRQHGSSGNGLYMATFIICRGMTRRWRL